MKIARAVVPFFVFAGIGVANASSSFPAALDAACIAAGLGAPHLSCSSCHANLADPLSPNNPQAFSLYRAGGNTRLQLCIQPVASTTTTTSIPTTTTTTVAAPTPTPTPVTMPPSMSGPPTNTEGDDMDDDDDDRGENSGGGVSAIAPVPGTPAAPSTGGTKATVATPSPAATTGVGKSQDKRNGRSK